MTKTTSGDEAKGSLETPAEQRAHLRAILEKTDDVMFLTYAAVGTAPEVEARPLHVTELDEAGDLWFMVGLDSRKVADLRRVPRATITSQDGKRWLQLHGVVEIVTDKTRVRALWRKLHEVWFPDGPDDPDVGLLRFRPEHGEYWDNSGAVGVKYLLEAARALVAGDAAHQVKGVHGEVGRRP